MAISAVTEDPMGFEFVHYTAHVCNDATIPRFHNELGPDDRAYMASLRAAFDHYVAERVSLSLIRSAFPEPSPRLLAAQEGERGGFLSMLQDPTLVTTVVGTAALYEKGRDARGYLAAVTSVFDGELKALATLAAMFDEGVCERDPVFGAAYIGVAGKVLLVAFKRRYWQGDFDLRPEIPIMKLIVAGRLAHYAGAPL